MKLLQFEELRTVKGICFTRVHIGRLVRAGLFPQPIKVGVRSIAFIEAEIDEYLARAAAARADGRASPDKAA